MSTPLRGPASTTGGAPALHLRDVGMVFGAGGPRPVTALDGIDLTVAPGELVDLEPAVRDAIVLELPFQPVCDGPCQQDYEIGVSEQAPLTEEPADPRWAALQSLLESSDDSPSGTREKS